MPEPERAPRERTVQTERRMSADSAESAQAQEGGIALHPEDGEVREWLSLAEAQRELGIMSVVVVAYWAGMGWLRSRSAPDGGMKVLRADVVREKTIRDGLGAIGGEELTPEELDELVEGGPGTLPWERDGANPSR